MFFHTNYIEDNYCRFRKEEVDGACNDSRFESSFFIDMFFGEQPGDHEGSVHASNFWQSLEHNLHKSDSEYSGNSDDEPLDQELIDSYREKLAATENSEEEDSDEDLDDYFKNLENKK